MSSAASNNRKSMEVPNSIIDEGNEPIRELFEACKTGDLAKVKKFINPGTVNARDVNGRRSTALHFSAGKYYFSLFMFVLILGLCSIHNINTHITHEIQFFCVCGSSARTCFFSFRVCEFCCCIK